MKLFKLFNRSQWEVRRTIWPYPEGYGAYNPATRTLIDAGVSKEAAQRSCDKLNNRVAAGWKGRK